MKNHPALPYVAVPPGRTGGSVLVIHSWWGLTTSFTGYADRLAAAGFLAGCADLYGGKIAATEEGARALRAGRRGDPIHKTLIRCIDTLLAHPASAGGRVALVGFSMGGHWAVWLGQRPNLPITASVLYYAARGGDFSAADSPILAHFAGRDSFVSAAARKSMETAIRRAGRPYTSYDYPGTRHWFAEDDEAAYDGGAADLAFERTAAFLGETSA